MNRHHDDRGAISVFVAVAAVAFVLLVGIAVDLTGQVATDQRARDVAAQAARAGGQRLQEATAVQGDGAYIDPALARVAAEQFVAAAGMDATVTVTSDATLQVQATTRYQTKFLSAIGISTLPASGDAEARLARIVGGDER